MFLCDAGGKPAEAMGYFESGAEESAKYRSPAKAMTTPATAA
jgi:Tfp pilus assembly protein PilF